jgi:hypothetical protein
LFVVELIQYNSNQKEAEKVVGLVAEAGQKAVALQLDTGNVGAFSGGMSIQPTC